MAAGVPDDLYQKSTPHEVRLLLDAIAEREARQVRLFWRMAGFVAAEIRNSRRSKDSDKYWTPDNIFKRTEPRSVEEVEAYMDRLMMRHNATLQQPN